MTLNIRLFPTTKAKSNLLALAVSHSSASFVFLFEKACEQAHLGVTRAGADERCVYAAHACVNITRAPNLVPSAVHVWKLLKHVMYGTLEQYGNACY